MSKSAKTISILVILTSILGSTSIAQITEVQVKRAETATFGKTAADYLPDVLQGAKATSAVTRRSAEEITTVYSEKANAFREYGLRGSAVRSYGAARVEILESNTVFGAVGLFTFESGPSARQSLKAIGRKSVSVSDGLLFWEDRFVVRVSAFPTTATRVSEAVAKLIQPASEITPPVVLGVLPANGRIESSMKYVRGPAALSTFYERAPQMFIFPGEAEGVVAEYAVANGASTDKENLSRPQVIVIEYHLPQFATDGMAHLTSYVEALPPEEQQKIVFRREGNFAVVASGFPEREAAERLISEIKYPYEVKWLRDPFRQTDDAFHGEKAAQMLLSTFGIIGLMLGGVLFFGSIFGATVFFRRRRAQQTVFSDAGGMLRLNLDPVEASLLGLPPVRKEEK